MREPAEPYATHLPPLLAAAFAEDLPDITAAAVFAPDDRLSAVLVAKRPGVLAGMPAFAAAFAFLDPECEADLLFGDGDAVNVGTIVAHVGGRARAVLAAERTALNFACRLSGIATLTRAFADALIGTTCQPRCALNSWAATSRRYSPSGKSHSGRSPAWGL